jgi:sec-independent protein translocase protein TatC
MLIILNHWYEVKIRLFYTIFSFMTTFTISYLYSDILMYFFVLPFVNKFDTKKFIFTNLSEAFSSCLLISLNFGSLLTSFVLIWMLLCFLKSGLYQKELKIIRLSMKLFVLSTIFCLVFVYFLIIPGMISFFGQFESSKLFELTLEARIFDYLNLILNCFFWVSFVLQLPTMFFLLIYFNIIKINLFLHRRKELIVFCFILGALFSPPDILTQLLIAFPLLVLSEIAILFFIAIDEYTLIYLESCSNGKRSVC